MHAKVSRYTLVIPVGPKTHFVNTFSGASIALGEAEREGVEAVFAEAASGPVRPEWGRVADLLLDNGFLVPVDTDEIAGALEKYDRVRSDPNIMSLTIATTMQCNMGCYYCFEDRKSTASLDGGDIDAIIRFVADRLPVNGRLHITWFGGEPLLAKVFVLEASRALMDLAASRSAGYSASMVSNGYNLDAATARELRDHQVRSIQITLDGDRAHHDDVRRHLVKSGERVSSYARIVENVRASASSMSISLRVNVSKLNAQSIRSLIDDLADEGLVASIASIYFAPLHSFKVTDPTRGYQVRERVHFTSREFAEIEVELLEHAAARGFRLSDWANPSYAGCIAVAKNGFVIDSNGEVKKCDHELGEAGTELSSLRDASISNADNERKWIDYRPEANPGCSECVLLPVCYSHCPHKNMAAETPEMADKCPSHKYNWERTLPLVLAQRAQIGRNQNFEGVDAAVLASC